MKNIFLFLVLFFCVATGYAQQYPVNQTLGAPTTLVTSRGGFKADSSFILPAYSDTNKANANPYVKNYAGSLIKVGNTIYVRSTDLSQWILVGSGGGTTPTLQQVTDAGSTTTNTITVQNVGASTTAKLQNNGVEVEDVGGYKANYLSNGFQSIYQITGNYYNLIGVGPHSYNNQTLLIPQTGGVLTTRVNGTLADSSGNITISTGGGAVDTIFRTLGKDSIFYKKNNITYAIKDSVDGGGGIGGSGSQYYVPKFSASTTLQNSQIFDSVNVGINTITPSYKLDVNGKTRIKAERSGETFLIEDSLGNDRIKVSNDSTFITGGTIPLTIIGSGGVQARIGNDGFLSPANISKLNSGVLTFFGKDNDNNGFLFDFNNQQLSTSATSAMINLGGNYNNQQSFAFSNLLISPTYNFDSTNVTTSAIARGIYYNPTIPLNGLRSAKHIAFESTSGNVVMKGIKKSNSTTDSIAIWINDTLSKAPYPSGGNGGAVDTIFRTLGKDSIFYKKNNITYAIKDSVGGGLSTVYQNEIHVSKDGSDVTGDGTLLKPYATITQGLTLVAGTRKTIVLHPGSYSENPNITVQYTVITTFELLGGNTEIVGTVSTSTGCTISGIKMTNLTISNLTGTGNVNVLNCDISGTLSKSSTGDYTLIRFCDIGITSITSSAGTVAIFGGNPNFITVNNVGARVVVKNCTTIAPVLTAGSLSLVDCIIFAITGTSNALTAAAGTYTTLANSQLIVPTFTNFARVSIAGFYSIINTIYDRGLSTLTGTSTNSIVNSQFINADKFIKQGGTSSQFLKADGSVDSSTYLSASDTISLSNRIDNVPTNLELLQLMSYGIKAEPYGITLANMSGQLGLSNNRLYFYPFNWNVSDTLRGVSFFNRSAFTNTPSNYNGIAIYSLSGGTLNRIVFTANDGTFWNTAINSWKSVALTPTFLTKGIYFIAYEFSGTGTPTMGSGAPLVIASTQSPSEPPSNNNINNNGIKFSTFITNSTATPPSSVAMSATAAVVNVPYFLFY
jgi:hypothetical protein